MIVLANHKGGVTTTTSTANLGAMLAERGCRILIVDCDPQANLSEAFGWTEEVVGTRLEDLIAQPQAATGYAPPAALMADINPMPRWRELLRILPCTDLLAHEAADLPARVGQGYEFTIRSVVETQRGAFDVILLRTSRSDRPPGATFTRRPPSKAAVWLEAMRTRASARACSSPTRPETRVRRSCF